MSQIERYRVLYEHEKDCNLKMLAMLESVPEAHRSNPRFQQAVSLAGHLAACRENWLNFMEAGGSDMAAWYDKGCQLTTLRPRFAAVEAKWTDYLARLDDERLPKDFEFIENGQHFSLPVEVQIEQLVGHCAYHRGQIVLLVDQLGGKTVDTDYVSWAWPEASTP
jgi:uncharacterized damage-inducible protein DinB